MAQYRYKGNIIVKKSNREDYKYAVIAHGEDGKIYKIFISTTREKIEAMLNTEINRYCKEIKNLKAAIKAIDEGKDFYFGKFCGRTYKEKVHPEGKAYYENAIKGQLDCIERIRNTWEIVEVEKV